MVERRLFAMYASFRCGEACISLYSTLKDARREIASLAKMEEETKRVPALKTIEHLLKTQGDFWYEFESTTWVFLQEIDAKTVKEIMRR